MKKIVLFSLFILWSCNTAIETKIVNNATNIENAVETKKFQFIDEILSGKDIVILGEASHGDGKTFEVKSDLVKYLVEQKGFNTIAFEARDFIEMEYINGRTPLDSLINSDVKNNWVRNWSPWGQAQQIQTLIDVIEENPLKFIGLETYSYRSIGYLIPYLKQNIPELDKDEMWQKIQDIHLKIYFSNPSPFSEQEIDLYIEYFHLILNRLNQQNEEDTFLMQMVENAITNALLRKYQSAEPTEENENKSVAIRDEQMAKNLIWYKKNNSDAKIIVWMANFHGAINLKDVTFENGDPERYKKFDVFGEHISKIYGEKVYSIAFTSSQGTARMPYDFEDIPTQKIDAFNNTLEKELDNKSFAFAFINFSEIRKNKPSLADEYFNSIMLGYVNQNGKWLNAFDGLFYIRENEPALPIGL